MCGWQVKLCDPSLTRAISERLRDEQLIIKRCTTRLTFTFTICMLRVASVVGVYFYRRPAAALLTRQVNFLSNQVTSGHAWPLITRGNHLRQQLHVDGDWQAIRRLISVPEFHRWTDHLIDGWTEMWMSTYYLVTYFSLQSKICITVESFFNKNPFATARFVTSPTRPTAVVRWVKIL